MSGLIYTPAFVPEINSAPTLVPGIIRSPACGGRLHMAPALVPRPSLAPTGAQNTPWDHHAPWSMLYDPGPVAKNPTADSASAAHVFVDLKKGYRLDTLHHKVDYSSAFVPRLVNTSTPQ